MLDRIKGIVNSKDSIDEINVKLGQQQQLIEEMSDEQTTLKKDFSDIQQELRNITTMQQGIVKQLYENLTLLDETRFTLEKEVDDFKIVKSKLQKTVLEQLSQEFRKELQQEIDRLRTDVDSFNHLKHEVMAVAVRTTKLAGEIDKLAEISGKLKKEDFELSKFAQKLMQYDREKLRLMRQVDMLERLVSQERRRKAMH